MPTDETTTNRAYPVPVATNQRSYDVWKLRAALEAIDQDIQDLMDQPAGGGSRASANTTITVSPGATATGSITLPRTCVLLSIQLDGAGWVRVYDSAAASAGDAARGRAVAPALGAGVVADPVFTGASTIALEPLIMAANAESPATNTYPVRVTNDGAGASLTLTITYTTLEA